MDPTLVNRIAAHLAGTKFVLASAESIKLTEAQLGFALPELLKSLYLNIANGGFGPGYGIIGIAGGHRSSIGSLVETYNDMIRGAQYLGLEWNPRCLPICDWGDSIYSCVDCATPGNPILRSDECKAHPVNYGLEDFFEMWLEGRDLFSDGAPKARTVEIINPFTGKKTRVKSR